MIDHMLKKEAEQSSASNKTLFSY